MTAPVSDVKTYADFSGLDALKRGAQNQDPKALRETARQFEAIFARMMIKSMRDANFGDKLLGSDQQDFYQGMFDDRPCGHARAAAAAHRPGAARRPKLRTDRRGGWRKRSRRRHNREPRAGEPRTAGRLHQ